MERYPPSTPPPGRLGIRGIWGSTEFNDYLNFPYVGQGFCINAHTHIVTHTQRNATAYGITSLTPQQADPARLLELSHAQWTAVGAVYLDKFKSVLIFLSNGSRKTAIRRKIVGAEAKGRLSERSSEVQQVPHPLPNSVTTGRPQGRPFWF